MQAVQSVNPSRNNLHKNTFEFQDVQFILPEYLSNVSIQYECGSGSEGRVYIAERDGLKCAIKIVLLSEHDSLELVNDFKREIEITKLASDYMIGPHYLDAHISKVLRVTTNGITKTKRSKITGTTPFGFLLMQHLNMTIDDFADMNYLFTKENRITLLSCLERLIGRCAEYKLLHNDLSLRNMMLIVGENTILDVFLIDFENSRIFDTCENIECSCGNKHNLNNNTGCFHDKCNQKNAWVSGETDSGFTYSNCDIDCSSFDEHSNLNFNNGEDIISRITTREIYLEWIVLLSKISYRKTFYSWLNLDSKVESLTEKLRELIIK